MRTGLIRGAANYTILDEQDDRTTRDHRVGRDWAGRKSDFLAIFDRTVATVTGVEQPGRIAAARQPLELLHVRSLCSFPPTQDMAIDAKEIRN